MATYTYNAWETINLPVVSGDTSYIITNIYTTGNPSNLLTGVISSGKILDGFGLQNVNEIISPYVKTEDLYFPTGTDISSLTGDDEQNALFYVFYSQDGWTNWTYDTINLIYNWAYETSLPYSRSYRPINLLDYRQYFIFSIQNPVGSTQNNVGVSLERTQVDIFSIEDATIWTYMLRLDQLTYPGAFSYAYSYDFDVNRTYMLPGTYNTLTIADDERTFSYRYYVTNTCYKYALYYLNDMGGWDYMLFLGRELQKDDIKRLQYKKNYTAQAFDWGKVNYLTQINEKWELNTSFLNDTQSENLQPLFHSNKMFLQDLNNGKLIPVNITNTNVEHKTFKNQGRKLYTYTINLESAQEKFAI